jgi:sugar/nucleoside kinase (ribokinase family)/8-oxo-dGTP pyrophosphatase MutT (NUDIX family)
LQTLVGPDAFGRFVAAELAREGVDVSALGTHASAKTGVAFVALGADGARSFLFFRHPSADLAIEPAQIIKESIANACLLHLGSSTLSREPARAATLRAVELAAESGTPISIDPNLRPHLWDDLPLARGLLRPILARAAVVKISDDELGPLLDIKVGRDVRAAAEQGARALRQLGCGVALVTLGDHGAWFDAPCGKGHVPAISTRVVDATGAGDAFVAGFWAELVEELRATRLPAELPRERIEAAVQRGCRLGAEAVGAIGATSGVARSSTAFGPGPQPWRFVDEESVLTTRIFRVARRRLVSPRTEETRDFSLIECPDWCNVVALTDGGEVVMVRQVRHGLGEVTLELPGGMIDPEDESPLAGCVRELLEETGFAGRNAELIGVIAPNPAMQSNRCHTALVRHAARVAELKQDAGEDLEVVLVPYREIPARIARGEITHALVVVAFAWALGLCPP